MATKLKQSSVASEVEAEPREWTCGTARLKQSLAVHMRVAHQPCCRHYPPVGPIRRRAMILRTNHCTVNCTSLGPRCVLKRLWLRAPMVYRLSLLLSYHIDSITRRGFASSASLSIGDGLSNRRFLSDSADHQCRCAPTIRERLEDHNPVGPLSRPSHVPGS